MNNINKNIIRKKKISIFQFLIYLFILSGTIVFYINNIISVNLLISQNNELKESINSLSQANYTNQILIEKLTSYERIKILAFEKFQLKASDTGAINKNIIIIDKSEY